MQLLLNVLTVQEGRKEWPWMRKKAGNERREEEERKRKDVYISMQSEIMGEGCSLNCPLVLW